MIHWSDSIAKIQGTFHDKDGNICLIQEGNLANKNAVLRLGVLYEQNDRYNTPMALTVEQVKMLLPLLQFFVDNECLPFPNSDD